MGIETAATAHRHAALAVTMLSKATRGRRLVRQNEAESLTRSGERAYTRAPAPCLRGCVRLHRYGLAV